MSQICDRCGSPTYVTTMSYFNSEIICDECDDLEQKHPDYQKARAAESAQVEQGNYNFAGVGLPAGYREWARGKKAELAAEPDEDDDEKPATPEDILALIEEISERIGVSDRKNS